MNDLSIIILLITILAMLAVFFIALIRDNYKAKTVYKELIEEQKIRQKGTRG